MKKLIFALLSFLTGVYFTIGSFSLFIYLAFLTIKLGRRNFLVNSEVEVLPPYPIGFTVGFYA